MYTKRKVCKQMKNEKAALEDKTLSNIIQNEFLNLTRRSQEEKIEDIKNLEFISKSRAEEEISPILKMNEDQVLNFVETFDVSMLSKLTVKELNYIGEVLGVEPEILFGFSENE